MSLINKLSIQGIRSFGLDFDDSQTIEFSSPVTLIVGENGSGKTTIIECLKYAITGEFPPGSRGVNSFIHQSGLEAGRETYKGKITLSVTDENDTDKIITREIKLIRRQGSRNKSEKINSIAFHNHENDQIEKIQGTDKFINNYMCNTMGVSKSILENVIFCHQEDSNWPFLEAQKVKDRFDEIFGTCKYNKAIDKLIDMRKNYEKKHKQVKSDIPCYELIKNQVEAIEEKIKDSNKQIEEIDENCTKFDENLEKLEDEKKKAMEKEKNYSEISNEIVNCERIVEVKKVELEKLNERIQKNGKLEENLENLEKLQMNFETDQKERKTKVESHESDLKSFNFLKECKQRKIEEIKEKLSKYQNDKKLLQDRLDDRLKMTLKICSDLGISNNPETVISDIKTRILEVENAIKQMKINADKEDSLNQQSIDKIRQEKVKLESKIENQRETIQKLTENLEILSKEIQISEEMIPKSMEIQEKIDEIENKLNFSNDLDKMEKLLEVFENSLVQMDEELKISDKNLEILHSVSKITNELDTKEKELTEKQTEYLKIRNSTALSLAELFPNESIESNFKLQVKSFQSKLQDEIEISKIQLTTLKIENERILIEKTNNKSAKTRITNDIEYIEEKIRYLCGDLEYLDCLESQKEIVTKQNMELAHLESSRTTYQKYIEKINDGDCCPLCSKGFKNDEAGKLIETLNIEITQLPQNIENSQKILQIETQKFDKLNGMKSSFDNLQSLKNDKIKIETDLKGFETNLNENAEKIEKLEELLSKPLSLFDKISPDFIAEMIKLDELQYSIDQKRKEVDEMKTKIPENIPKISLNDAIKNHKEIAEKIASKNESRKNLQKEISQSKNNMMELKEELNKLHLKKSEISRNVQNIEKLKEKFENQMKEKNDLEIQNASNKNQINPMNEKIKKLLQEKNEKRQKIHEKIEKGQDGLKNLQFDNNKLDDLCNQIKILQNFDLDGKIKTESLDLQKFQEKIDEINQKYEIKLSEMQKIREILNKGEITLYNINDNISYFKIQNDVKNIQIKSLELKKLICDVDYEKLNEDQNRLLKEIEEINTKRYKLQGTKESILKTIKDHEKELEDPKYQNAKEKYQDSIIREHVLKLTIKDLNKYYQVLEKAVLKFHQEKMDQINATIRSLWNDIYSGNDIDAIMIKTHEEGTNSSDKKRSYNYRVCQKKLNGEWCEMRGRCSAGQKLLASLIIRIALADTFSSKCGILALDEPTANLDEKNIKSLSEELSRLVAQRSDGKFMLLIITHNESFIQRLEQADKYLKVYRDDRGISTIEDVSYA